MNLANKNVVIYGGGLSGVSAYELVKDKGARAIIYDDNPNVPHATSSVGVLFNADIIVLSPGVKSENPYLLDAKLEGKQVIGEIELASSLCKAEQIAVTGTNGKTTATLLIDHVLKRAGMVSTAVGNVGIPFTSVCDKMDALDNVVIEASSFQLESAVDFAPDVAVMLNITPDHLDRHVSMKRYADAKANVFRKQCEKDKIVFNVDDEYIGGYCEYMVAEKIPFSTSHPVDGAYVSSGFVCYKGLPIVEVADIEFRGRELQNVLSATAVAMSKGVSAYTIASALSSFKRPQFRRQFTAQIGKVRVYNDSKSTNVDSTLSAIEGIKENIVLIVGGEDRGENLARLFDNLPNNVLAVVAMGENKEKISSNCTVNCLLACDMQDAVDKGIEQATLLGADLLFSPASKSFDCYKSYVERGKNFDRIVRKK